jgi:hypothetical protein
VYVLGIPEPADVDAPLGLTWAEVADVLVVLEPEGDVLIETHLILPALPLISMYCQFPEQGLGVVILTLFTYIVKGALLISVYPPAHPTVPPDVSLSPPSHRPS